MRDRAICFSPRSGSGARAFAGAPLIIFFLSFFLFGGCASPAPPPNVDALWTRYTRQARAAFDEGDSGRAASLYTRALSRARAMDDAAAIGDSAYNLAACLLDGGDALRARPYLAEARAEIERCGGSPASALLLDAEAARVQGRLDEAAALCREVLSLPGEAGKKSLLLEVRLFEAHLACDAGDKTLAREKLDEALALMQSAAGGEWLRARAAQVTGRVLLLEAAFAEAAAAFDCESDFLRRAGRFGGMAGALLRAGRAFLDAGEAAPAADRLYRAARSFFGQGAVGAARKAAESARSAAEKAGSLDLESRIEALLAEIGRG